MGAPELHAGAMDCLARGGLDGALSLIRSARAKAPTSARILHDEAKILLALDRIPEAAAIITMARSATTRGPRS